MDNQKTIKVRGSAIITADNKVFFTPYRKLEAGEKPQKAIAACKITSRQYLIQEFIKLTSKL
jgi:hypothetical protein